MSRMTTSVVRPSTVWVRDQPIHYLAAGEGHPVVFVHGWALSEHSYRAALRRLVDAGARVYAPALPGFGGTPALPAAQRSLSGYAAWLAEFLTEVDAPAPVTVIGHSFGGGVALQLAHDFPDLVGRLVLVDSIGGSSRHTKDPSRRRPWWDWGLHLSASTLSRESLTRVVPVVATDAIANALRSPSALWHVGRIAREANLEVELAELRRRRLPIFVLWGRQDTVLPLAAAKALMGDEDSGVLTVPGEHNWLISNPDLFAEVMTNVLDDGPALKSRAAPRPGRDAQRRRVSG